MSEAKMVEKSRFELALVNFGECVKHMENSIGLLRAGDNREALCEARAAKRFAYVVALLLEGV